MYYDYVFVVLVYLNVSDIIGFIRSVAMIGYNSKIILVNSYSNEEVSNKVNQIARNNGCDFLETENKGYGFGNNIGINYAIKNYEFSYLIVSNADVIVKKIGRLPSKNDKVVIGPIIKNKNGKLQNPYLATQSLLRNKLMYLGYKNNSEILLFISRTISRITKLLFIIKSHRSKTEVSTFSLHGSFLIFTHTALSLLYPVFDEQIFLFSEELDLALRARELGIKMVINRETQILHLEDGSMKYESNSYLGKIERESFIHVYEKWYK